MFDLSNVLSILIGIGLGLLFVRYWTQNTQKTKNSQTATVQSLKKPIIRMAYNGEELVVDSCDDLGNHWYIKGHIPAYGGFSGVEQITFRVPKGLEYLRLHYAPAEDYVLINEAIEGNGVSPAYVSDTSAVRETLVAV